MIRRFCDCCSAEITDANRIDGEHHRLTARLKRKSGVATLSVEVICAHDSTWNAGDFCKHCVIDAINEADDRPRHADAVAP